MKHLLIITVLLLTACGGGDGDSEKQSNSSLVVNNECLTRSGDIIFNCSSVESSDGDCDICFEELSECEDLTDDSFDDCEFNHEQCLLANQCASQV